MPTVLQRLKERKIVQWAAVYLAGAWLSLEALGFVADTFAWPAFVARSAVVLVAVGFFAVLVLAWYHGEKGRQRASGVELLILAGILVIAGAVVALLGRGEVTGPEPIGWQGGTVSDSIDPKSIAVLPFANLSVDPNNEYFSDGITSDIINHLARSADLQVIARTSVMQYKDTDKPIRQVGRELGVAAIVEGEVQRSGHQVRINAQLIDANTDLHLWADTYNRELTTDNLFEIQSDIAQRIASALHVTLAPGNESRLSREPTDSLRAYEYSQRGMYQLYRGYEDDLSQAILMLDSAIAVDPEYAEAYSCPKVLVQALADA